MGLKYNHFDKGRYHLTFAKGEIGLRDTEEERSSHFNALFFNKMCHLASLSDMFWMSLEVVFPETHVLSPIELLYSNRQIESDGCYMLCVDPPGFSALQAINLKEKYLYLSFLKEIARHIDFHYASGIYDPIPLEYVNEALRTTGIPFVDPICFWGKHITQGINEPIFEQLKKEVHVVEKIGDHSLYIQLDPISAQEDDLFYSGNWHARGGFSQTFIEIFKANYVMPASVLGSDSL